MSMTFESQRKSDKVFARLDVERPALLHSSTAKLNNNKLGRQDANTRAREGAPLASKSDNDKRLAVQSQRDMVPSAIQRERSSLLVHSKLCSPHHRYRPTVNVLAALAARKDMERKTFQSLPE